MKASYRQPQSGGGCDGLTLELTAAETELLLRAIEEGEIVGGRAAVLSVMREAIATALVFGDEVAAEEIRADATPR
jgi:hypothetical protein